MEPIQYFTLLVLAVCVIHLAETAGAWINAWRHATGRGKKRLEQRATEAGISRQGQIQQRSDWYAYFHCADLVGPEPRSNAPSIPRTGAAPRQKRNAAFDTRCAEVRLSLS